jgi:hypothetical protein
MPEETPQQPEQSLAEQVEPVVAGRAVGADADPDAHLVHARHGGDAAGELAVRTRAVRDRGALGGEPLQVFVVQVHGVDRDHLGTDQSERVESRERAPAVPRDSLVDLVGSLVHVDVDRQADLARKRRDLAQRVVGHRVRRVRRQAEADKRLVAHPVAQRQSLAQVLGRSARVDGGEVDDDDAVRAADADGERGLDRRLGEEVHVVHAGRSAEQHLGESERGAVAHELRIDQLRLERPDALAQPRRQRQVVADAAQQRHRGVRVQVDEPGHEQVPG